jgi:hypothetical protein
MSRFPNLRRGALWSLGRARDRRERLARVFSVHCDLVPNWAILERSDELKRVDWLRTG